MACSLHAMKLLKKDLQIYRISYAEMYAVLFEVEMILNNSPLTYAYPNEIANAVTPNHLLFTYFNIRSNYTNTISGTKAYCTR